MPTLLFFYGDDAESTAAFAASQYKLHPTATGNTDLSADSKHPHDIVDFDPDGVPWFSQTVSPDENHVICINCTHAQDVPTIASLQSHFRAYDTPAMLLLDRPVTLDPRTNEAYCEYDTVAYARDERRGIRGDYSVTDIERFTGRDFDKHPPMESPRRELQRSSFASGHPLGESDGLRPSAPSPEPESPTRPVLYTNTRSSVGGRTDVENRHSFVNRRVTRRHSVPNLSYSDDDGNDPSPTSVSSGDYD